MSKQKEQTPKTKIPLASAENALPVAPPLPSWLIAGDSKETVAKIRDLYGSSPGLRFIDDLLDWLTQRDNV